MKEAWTARTLTVAALICFVLSCALDAGESLRLEFRRPFLEQARPRTEPQQTLTIRPCAREPKIDGDLDDGVWTESQKIESLAIPTPATTTWLCYDAQALYIGVRCEELPGREAQAAARARDGKVWTDDCVEVWIDSDPEQGMVHQFVVSVANCIFDSRQGNPVYNPKWSHSVKRGDGVWNVEMAIPFAALGLSRPVTRVGFNVGRNGAGLTPRAWTKSYGDTAKSALILEGAAPKEAKRGEAERTRSNDDLAIIGNSLAVRLDRTYASPGERWIEATLNLRPKQDLRRTRLEAALCRIGNPKPIESIAITPTLNRARLLVDLRGMDLPRGLLSMRYVEDGEETGAATVLLSARPCLTPLTESMRIPVTLDLPGGIDALEAYPVTFGVPFGEGALWDANRVRLIDGSGRETPCQTEVAGCWGYEGAIKWLRFDALVSAPNAYFIQVAPRTTASRPHTALTLTEGRERFSIDTGAARYVLGKGPSPIREIWIGSRRMATVEGSRGLYLVDQKGRTAAAHADGETTEIEVRGPVAACVRFEGFYRTSDGEPLARHVTRVELFAGRRFADVTHTLIITRNTNDVWFREIGWELTAAPGPAPQALFGTARSDLTQWRSVPLRDSRDAYMIQDRHYRFAHGENHFMLAAGGETILEGEECGDGGALLGQNGGVLLNCRDAARLHPKEFLVARDRISLKLFSNRAGEELDFRPAALAKKWDLEMWFDNALFNGPKPKNYLQRLLSYDSNGVGWSRTHLLRVSPLAPAEVEQAATRLSQLHSGRVYLHNSPQWIRETEVFGRLHPRDPERFPITERTLEDAFAWWKNMDARWGEHGFMDYFSGPHIVYRRGKYAMGSRYINCTYTLRNNLWLAYVRSGDRAVREFAVGTNRTQLDNLQCHWPRDTVPKGLFRNSAKTENRVPIYWGETPKMEMSSSTNLDQYLNLYYLCGYRRAKDCVEQWCDAIKEYWTPAKARRTMRILMVVRQLAQAYALTWDPDLKELADATTDIFEDRESELLLTKNRPYHSTTYKTAVDVRGLLDAWNVFGQRRHYDMARRVAELWWRKTLGENGYGYNPPHAIIGNFLYSETGNPAYAEGLAAVVAEHANAHRPALCERVGSTAGLNDYTNAAGTSFTFEVGYALDVLVRSDADRRHAASWFCFEDAHKPATVVLSKRDEEHIDFVFKTATDSAIGSGNVYVGLLDKQAPGSFSTDQGLNRLCALGGGIGDLRIAKDGPAGLYRVTFARMGEHCLFASRRVPMVLHAPGYCWFPSSAGKHCRDRYYVKLPNNEENGQLFFEGKALLFDPEGQPSQAGEEVTGWIKLPAAKPGLWSFELLENRIVGTRNVPPVFALHPDEYFDPGLPWERGDETEDSKTAPGDQVYVPGAIATPGNLALHVTPRRSFRLAGGEPHSSGDGRRFLPFREGTVEFFIKPYWGTFDVVGEYTLLARLSTEGHNWNLSYCMKPDVSLKFYTYSLFSSVPGRQDDRAFTTRGFRFRTFIEAGRWIHLAWVWRMKDGGVQTFLFVDGKRGRSHSAVYGKTEPAFAPTALLLARQNAAYDELRLSDIPRYTTDFTPPTRDRELKVDEHTRALLHFNGDLRCMGHAGQQSEGVLE